jgi:hypothetical protein
MTKKTYRLNTYPLRVYAGDQALTHIRQNGLAASDIKALLGASSGPKWIVLHGIDRFLQEQFFQTLESDLELLGTSAGAWRMACYAHQNVESAYHRLTDAYIEQRYSEKPSGREVNESCRNIIKQFLGEDGSTSVLNSRGRLLNIIASQCHGLTANDSKHLKSFGFGMAAISNRFSRKTLAWQFTRIMMNDPRSHLFKQSFGDLPTRYATLNENNLEDSLLATGSIPIIIDGVRDIAGEGIYQDGGITDYAFDLPLHPEDGFVLFPHFAQIPVPGWFDKGWINQYKPWRKPSKENYSKTIMLVPSDEFVASLPHSKIPDRHDFLKLSDSQRISYWREVVSRTEELGEDLANIDWQSRVEELPW